MATMYECDRCKEIVKNVMKIKIYVEQDTYMSGVELCPDCYKDVKSIIEVVVAPFKKKEARIHWYTMKVALYAPDDFSKQFVSYVNDVTFLDNYCDETVDFIYAYQGSLSKGVEAKERAGKPLIAYLWDIPAPTGRDVAPLIHMLKQCDKILCGSNATLESLRSYGLNGECVYYCVIAPVVKREKKKSIIQISRIVPHKRFDIGIKAANLLNIPITVIGGIADPNYFASLPKKGVEFLTNIPLNDHGKETVMGKIAESSILIAPTVFEGWGLTPIEAVMNGTNVILNSLDVFMEVWGTSVFYHEQDNVEDLAAMIEGVLNMDEAEYNRHLWSARECIKPFTPELFVDRWRGAIREFSNV